MGECQRGTLDRGKGAQDSSTQDRGRAPTQEWSTKTPTQDGMGPVKRKMKEGQMKIPSRTLPVASILKKGVREDMRESTNKAQGNLWTTQMIPTEREGRNKMRPTGTLWTEGKARAT